MRSLVRRNLTRALVLGASFGMAGPAAAQRLDAVGFSLPRPVLPWMHLRGHEGQESLEAHDPIAHIPSPPSQPAWWMPLASAVVPGAGQALLRQDRFVAYATVETVAWLRFTAERREGRRQRRAYRDLANRVARAWFSTEFPSGNFEYYERMQHYVESGVFDENPVTVALEPELDTLTFNGALWLLARRTYWEHPDSVPAVGSAALANATAFYLERAVRPEFRWSWRNAQLEHDLFRRTISESNEASRQAVQALGIVLANHVLSTVDAYVTLRLWTREQETRSLGIAATVPWAPLGRPSPSRPHPSRPSHRSHPSWR